MDATTRPGPVMTGHNWSGYREGFLPEVYSVIRSRTCLVAHYLLLFIKQVIIS